MSVNPPEPDDPPEPDEAIEIEMDSTTMQAWLEDDRPVVLLDIRERFEIMHGHAKGAILIRMNDVPNRLDELPTKDARLVVYCAHGVRSYGVTGWLRDQGWTDAWSLIGGFSAFMAAGGEAAQPTPGELL